MSNNKETAKHALLKELDDVQSLLDDADTPTQPPLLKPSAEDTTAPDSQRIRQLASERANPFLSGRPAPSTSPARVCARALRVFSQAPWDFHVFPWIFMDFVENRENHQKTNFWGSTPQRQKKYIYIHSVSVVGLYLIPT